MGFIELFSVSRVTRVYFYRSFNCKLILCCSWPETGRSRSTRACSIFIFRLLTKRIFIAVNSDACCFSAVESIKRWRKMTKSRRSLLLHSSTKSARAVMSTRWKKPTVSHTKRDISTLWNNSRSMLGKILFFCINGNFYRIFKRYTAGDYHNLS